MNEDISKEIIKKLENLESRLSLLEKTPLQKTSDEGKKLSVKEFILKKKPYNDVLRTLVIGYYLEHFEGASGFNRIDLINGFRAAKEPLPANVNDKVNSNIEKGYMMEEKGKKDKLTTWVLTNSGEKFVEEGLPESE